MDTPQQLFKRSLACATVFPTLAGAQLLLGQASEKSFPAQNGDDQPVYHVGKGVTPPRLTYDPQPEYTAKAAKAKIEERVLLSIVVDADGGVDKAPVVQGLDAGLDMNAVETVRKWRFDPATKDGKPVAVEEAWK
jgi:TonB family protein